MDFQFKSLLILLLAICASGCNSPGSSGGGSVGAGGSSSSGGSASISVGGGAASALQGANNSIPADHALTAQDIAALQAAGVVGNGDQAALNSLITH